MILVLCCAVGILLRSAVGAYQTYILTQGLELFITKQVGNSLAPRVGHAEPVWA